MTGISSLDKNAMTIAAGSFGVSFAFINTVVPLQNKVTPFPLHLSFHLMLMGPDWVFPADSTVMGYRYE